MPKTRAPDWVARFSVLDPPVSSAGAAVTLVLREGANDTEILLIERSKSRTDPASGQVALPGGRVDPEDGSLRATAVRELEEEVGLCETDLAGPVRFVRIQPAPRFGLRVGVFVGEIATSARSPRIHNPREVAHVFWLPKGRLDPPQPYRFPGEHGPSTHPASYFEGHIVWGFTRRVLRDFFGFPSETDVGGPQFAPSASESRDPPASPEHLSDEGGAR
ncbi:MAG: CoA pyrophosphatase [Thermoplasmata archaeon]